MTRSYASAQRRSRRITQPLRIVKPPRDPSITTLGFSCFRLVMGQPLVVKHSTNTMFAFVRARV